MAKIKKIKKSGWQAMSGTQSKPYQRKSKILMCECNRKYIKTRVGQTTCLLCYFEKIENEKRLQTS